MTDYEEFLELVRRLRAAQKAYFKDRKQSDLIESKKLEKQVDQALDAALNESDTGQMRMFEGDLEKSPHLETKRPPKILGEKGRGVQTPIR